MILWYSNKEVETQTAQYQKLEQITNTCLQKFRHQQEKVNAKQEKIKHLESHEYDPNCKYCTSNVFVQNAIEAQNTIDSDRALLEEMQQELAELKLQLDALKPIFEIADQYNKLKSNIATKKITLERNGCD